MVKKHKVYVINNIITNKKYVGCTTSSIKKRILRHIRDSETERYNSALHKSIRKYGKENFVIESIFYCDDKESMYNLEKEKIKEYKTYEEGYNLTFGGEGTHGLIFSDERKLEISKKMKNRVFSSEHKRKISESKSGEKHHGFGLKGSKSWNFGRKKSTEEIKKIKLSLVGKEHKGSKNGNSKLVEEQVIEIKKMFLSGKFTKTKIAEIFNTTVSNICSITNNQTWRQIKV